MGIDWPHRHGALSLPHGLHVPEGCAGPPSHVNTQHNYMTKGPGEAAWVGDAHCRARAGV